MKGTLDFLIVASIIVGAIAGILTLGALLHEALTVYVVVTGISLAVLFFASITLDIYTKGRKDAIEEMKADDDTH
jgi:hypothetical protein